VIRDVDTNAARREAGMDVNGYRTDPIRPGTPEPVEADVPAGTLPAERLLELRRRIRARMYDDPQVVDEMLRRMVDRGDL
jgi:hypothetical protein